MFYLTVEQMTSKQVNSYKEIDSKINEGTRNRTVASTNMNATSRYVPLTKMINHKAKKTILMFLLSNLSFVPFLTLFGIFYMRMCIW